MNLKTELFTYYHLKTKILVFIFLIGLFTNVKAQEFNSYSDLVYKVNHSVVQIIVDEFGSPSRFQADGTAIFTRNLKNGSGVIVDSEGYIITNRHVIDQAKTIQILLPPSFEEDISDESILRPEGDILVADVVGMDAETDIAVLKIEGSGYRSLKFGDSQNLRAGDIVFAFGSPLGLENSVSMGIVSATARQLRDEDPMIYIQTDATINPGNSGGPLVDTMGRIVGINTLNLSQSGGSEGLGFAAPSHIVESIYKQIKEKGSVERGVIGINPQTVSPVLAKALGLPANQRVILGDVAPGSPADFAGLQEGDIILKLDGKVIENARQLNVNIYGKEIDSAVELEIKRGGEILKREVRVSKRDDRQSMLLNLVDPEENFIPKLGILAIGLSPEIREMLPPLRKRGGVLVAASNGKSNVMGDPFQPGDIIYNVNGEDITSYKQFYSIVDQLEVQEAVYMHVQRGNKLYYLSHRIID
ncbi:MAG: trypsin-like peptidase domain-containing protein [Balneolaceae bacterium]